jgi:lysophospholipase L1-like esterase
MICPSRLANSKGSRIPFFTLFRNRTHTLRVHHSRKETISVKSIYTTLSLISCLCLVCARPAKAQNPNNTSKDTRYLALGDSIAFGFNPTVAVALDNYHGYPEFVSNGLHRKVANASCFGESSGSFLSTSAPDLGCRAWKSAGRPMFVEYSGTQMDYAIDYLRNNPNPRFVTINIGGNDLALLQIGCNFDLNCELSGLPGVLGAYGSNLFTIFSRIRQEAHYNGPIVLLTYYAFNYADPTQVGAFTALNGIASGIASAFGAKIADGFMAFFVATIPFGGDSCKAGLLVKLPNGTCDTHPSLLGQKLLAEAVLAVAPNHNDAESGDGDREQAVGARQ